MAKFASTFFDPLGLGYGRAMTGKDSGFINLNPGKDKGGSNNQPPAATPSAPAPDAIAEEEKKRIQKKLSNRTRTNYTSPLGISEQANTAKQTLGE